MFDDTISTNFRIWNHSDSLIATEAPATLIDPADESPDDAAETDAAEMRRVANEEAAEKRHEAYEAAGAAAEAEAAHEAGDVAYPITKIPQIHVQNSRDVFFS